MLLTIQREREGQREREREKDRKQSVGSAVEVTHTEPVQCCEVSTCRGKRHL